MGVDVALIGAGGIGGKHLEHLGENSQANIVAVCDIDEETAKESAQLHDAAAYTDWETLFNEAEFEAVFICVPPFAREGQERLAAKKGIHMFVEKPLGLNREYPRNVLNSVNESNIITQVGHQMRYSESVEYAKELVENRALAAISAWWVSGVLVDEDHWWCNQDCSGGQIIEQGTHIFDLVRLFGGNVEHVYASGDNRVHSRLLDFPDAVSTTVRHEGGLPSQVITSAASPSIDLGVRLIGDGLMIDIDLMDNTCTGHVDGDEIDFQGDNDDHHSEVDAFIDAVDNGNPGRCRSPYRDALRTFDLTIAVTEAIDSNDAVQVNDEF